MSEPTLTEPYQIKLKQFLEVLPPYVGNAEGQTGEVKSMLPGSATLKTETGFSDAQIKEIFPRILSNKAFTDLTNFDHASLLRKWIGDRTTTCNAFVGACTIKMGYKPVNDKDGLGRFDIADYLARYGLGHCWVRPSTGATPEYGDIFRLHGDVPDDNGVLLNHMAVSLYIEGSNWFTAEAGQGGPRKGYDSVKRKRRDWMPGTLQGWVSMRALLNAGKRVDTWLGGWWEIEEGPYDTYYYNFASGGKVAYTHKKPAHPSAPPPPGCVVGNFTMKGMFGVEIRWQSADVDELLQAGASDSAKRKYTLKGKTKNGTELEGNRIMIEGLL